MLAEQTKSILDGKVKERAVIYCRVSTGDKEGDRLESQEETCRQYALDKGYEVVGVFKEDERGVSGTHLDTPEMYEIFKLADKDKFDILVIRDIERLSRDELRRANVKINVVRLAGKRLEYVWDQFDTDTLGGRLMENFKGTYADYEAERIRKRLHNGRMNKLDKGGVLNGGITPFGYENVKEGKLTKLKIIEDEANIIRRIFDLYVNQGKSLTFIAKQFNRERIPTYARLRKSNRLNFNEKSIWHAGTIRQILKNKTYIGTWEYGKKKITKKSVKANGKVKIVIDNAMHPEDHRIPIDVDAIVSQKVFDAAQERLSKNRTTRGRRTNKPYLLARRLECHCGLKMAATTINKTYLYYRCPSGLHHTKSEPCGQGTIVAKKLDELAWQWMYSLVSDSEKLWYKIMELYDSYLEVITPLKNKLSGIEQELTEAQNRYDKLINLYLASDDFGQEQLLGKKLEYEGEIKRLLELKSRTQEEIDNVSENDPVDLLIHESLSLFDAQEKGLPIEDTEDFNTRLKYAKRYSLQARLSDEGGIHLQCLLGFDYRESYNSVYALS